MTDQELADAIRNSYHFVAGWFANPPENSLGKPVSLQTADQFIAHTVCRLLRDNPPRIPAEGEEVRWRGGLWVVEHVHNGHAYLFASPPLRTHPPDHARCGVPLAELTHP